ncbi:type II secretion system F family protein [Patescibacteria group bacterium]
MPKYFYIAKNHSGQEKAGEIEASDEHQLARILRQEGYLLISTEVEKKSEKRNFNINIPFLSRVGLKDKIFFTRNLRVMVSAGIPLPRSLGTLAEITKNTKFKKTLLKLGEELNKGKSFSKSLKKYPDIFSDFFISLVKSGEESGTMEEVLKNLTKQMEREYELRSKITSAMIYPAVIIFAMLGIGALMLIMVVPRLAETFENLGVELPLATRLVISVGNFLAQNWYFAIIIFIIGFFIFRMIMKTKSAKKIFDKMSLKLPIFSQFVQKTNSAYTVRTLGSLISSGVPLINSLEITAGILGNSYFKEAMLDSVEQVKKGQKLSEALKKYENLYPSVVIQMIEVGEETGETSQVLQKLAEFFEEEVTNATKNLSAVIEPVLMLLIGGVIGFFAISMVQPMYSMLGAIK